MWPFTIFASYTLNQWKMLCYPQSKLLIDLLTGSMFSISLKLTLTVVFGGVFNIIKFESECTQRKLSFTDKKKSIKSLYLTSWNVLDAILWPFLVLTKSFTLNMNRIIDWNDHWIIFVETSMWNTLSTAKFIWNFPLRPQRKINIKQKNWNIFSFLICVQISVGVPFGYKKNLERFRRMRSVTIYDFLQLHLEPVKNAMLSPVKTFDWLFNRIYVFYKSQVNTDNCFWWCFQLNKDRKRMHSNKIIVYR